MFKFELTLIEIVSLLLLLETADPIRKRELKTLKKLLLAALRRAGV